MDRKFDKNRASAIRWKTAKPHNMFTKKGLKLIKILLFLIAVIEPYRTLSNCTTSVIAVENQIYNPRMSRCVSVLRLIAVIAVTYIYILISIVYMQK